jgi:hypothetical protein
MISTDQVKGKEENRVKWLGWLPKKNVPMFVLLVVLMPLLVIFTHYLISEMVDIIKRHAGLNFPKNFASVVTSLGFLLCGSMMLFWQIGATISNLFRKEF